MNQSHNETEFRPPLFSAGLAAGAGCASHYLYGLSQAGLGVAAPAAIAAGGVAALHTIRAIDDYLKLRRYRRKREKFKGAAKYHGKARFATMSELRNAKLIDSSNEGMFLGQAKGHDIWFNGETSGNFVGPPGSHKTTATILSSLLSISARTEMEKKTASSFLIADPSAEIYAITHDALRKAGFDVVVLSSWTGEVSALIDEPVTDARLNPYSSANSNADPATIRDEVELRTQLLVPIPRNADEKTKYFARGSRSLIECVTLWEYACNRKPDLVNIHDHIMASPEEMNDLFIQCMETSAFGGHLAKLGSTLSGLIGAFDQFAGYVGGAFEAVKPFDPTSSIGRHVTGTGFDVGRFKGDKPVAVFLIYPGKRSVTYQQLYNAEVSFLLEMICADPRKRQVTAIIDEAAGLGYVPSLLRFLNEGRKYHLRLFLYWQDLTGQAEMIYGKPGVRQILAAGDILWTSMVREPETCTTFSKIAGTQAFEDFSFNGNARRTSEILDQSLGSSNKGVPLIRDVRTELSPEEALIFYRNLPAIKAQKVPYYARPEWASIAGKHPYRDG